MINQKKLSLYLKNNLNVLLEGAHGVGKTAVIKEVFETAGLKWKYYSAATMDPWIDFIGVPKTVIDTDGSEVLELVKPKDLAHDEVEALFFDEFNRAPAKVMNAVMELIQFQSVNGKKFNNLKVVWASINPYTEDGTYNVENIDPAILDRFHINIKVPYELDAGYLFKTYGAYSKPFVKWWNELPKELKFKISPRRLDYAIKISQLGGDLLDVIPRESNIKKLHTLINENQENMVIEKIFNLNSEDRAKFFTFENTERFAQRVLKEKNGITLVSSFNKEYLETKIQSPNNDFIKNSLVDALVSNEELLGTISTNSQKTIEEIIKRRKEITRFAIPKNSLNAIQNMVRLSVKYSAKTFCGHMSKTFDDFLSQAKAKKSSDLPSYFEALFSTKDDQGNILTSKIIDNLCVEFKTASQSLNEDCLSFMGLFYNFAHKYADNDQKKKINNFVKAVFEISKKNRNNFNRSAEQFIFSFNESNWVSFRNCISALKSLKSFYAFKDFAVKHKIGDQSVFNIIEPMCLNDSVDFFCKGEQTIDHPEIEETVVTIKNKDIGEWGLEDFEDVSDIEDDLYFLNR